MAGEARVHAERLAAIDQYLYSFITGPIRRQSSSMPQAAWEHVVEAERQIDEALRCLTKPMKRPVRLATRTLHEAPAPNDLCAERARNAFCSVPPTPPGDTE